MPMWQSDAKLQRTRTCTQLHPAPVEYPCVLLATTVQTFAQLFLVPAAATTAGQRFSSGQSLPSRGRPTKARTTPTTQAATGADSNAAASNSDSDAMVDTGTDAPAAGYDSSDEGTYAAALALSETGYIDINDNDEVRYRTCFCVAVFCSA